MGARRGWSLRRRLTTLLLATLIPLAGLGGYWVVRQAWDERVRAEREAQGTAARVAAEAGHRVAVVHEMLAVLARLPAVQGRHRGESERLLKEILAASPHLENIFAFTAEGSLFATAVPVAPGVWIPIRDRAWFQAVVRSGQPVAGDFQVGRITGKPVAVLAHPVMDAQGRVLGVVGAALRLAAVSRDVSPAQIGPPVLWAVVDRQGLVLLDSDSGAGVGKPLGSLAGMLRAEAVVPGTQWRAVVSLSEAVVAARVRAELFAIGLPALLILLGATGVGFWIAYRTWHPLQRLAAAVRRVGAGEPGARVPVETGGEVGEVARAFAEAMDTLATRDQALVALFAVGKAILEARGVQPTVALILDKARELTGAETAGLLQLDAASGLLRYEAGAGLNEATLRDHILRPGEGVAGRAVAEDAPVWTADILNDPRIVLEGDNRERVRRLGLRAVLAAPLTLQGATHGALVVHHREPHAFGEDKVEVLSAPASLAAIALENARLYGEALEKTERLQGLIRTSAKVAGTLQTEEVLRDIAEEAAKLLGVEGAGFRLLEGDRLVVGGKYGLAHHVMLSPSYRVGESLTGRVAQEGHPISVPDLREDQSVLTEHKAAALTHGVVAYLGVPLRYRDRIIGVLNVYGKERRTFHEGEIGLLSAFADHAAVAIENARLFALSQRRLEQAQALFETGQAVGGILDLAQLFDFIIAKTAEHLKVRKCALWRVEVQGGKMALAFQAGRGLAPSFTAAFRMAVGEGTTGKAIELRRPVWSADILNDPAIWFSPQMRARVEAEGYRGVLSAPILGRGEPIGALVIHRDEAGPFADEEVEFLQSLANQAGLAISNARLFADLRGQTERLESLIRVSRLISSSLELEHVLSAIVRTCTELLGMDAATLWTLDEREGVLEAQVDYGLAHVKSRPRRRLEPGVGFVGQVLAERRVLVSANFAQDARVKNREWARREGLVAAAGVPLQVGDKALGTLAVFKRSPWTFSEAEIALLSSFASQAATALESARLFAALKEHSEHLEERVRARTAELEEANRAKSQFLANMSHELRTPLNAVIGFSSVLEEESHGPLTEKQRRYVGHIHASGQHLLAVINDILDLSKVEAGKLALTLQPVALGPVIEDSLTLVRGEAAAKGLRLEAEVPEGLPPALADPVRLKQILYNLLSNAVKFTPEAGAVTVWARAEEEGLAVWVRDTGIGIAPEDQDRIFREFEQADNSLGRQHQGTGLGLALTRRLVELQAGKIRVESEGEGCGSTFTFTMPTVEVGAGKAPPATPAAQA